MMIFEHYSDTKISLNKLRIFRNGQQDTGCKPNGFWITVRGEDDWPNWCNRNGIDHNLLKICHRVDIDLTDILVIDTKEKFEFFDSNRRIIKPLHRVTGGNVEVIDRKHIFWRFVAEKYKGIIIAPYFAEYALAHTWYENWDCASGCIWERSAIKKITLGMPLAIRGKFQKIFLRGVKDV